MKEKDLEIINVLISKLSMQGGDVLIIRTKDPEYFRVPLTKFFDEIGFNFPVLCLSLEDELFVMSPEDQEDNEKWDESFSKSQDQLEQMGKEALCGLDG